MTFLAAAAVLLAREAGAYASIAPDPAVATDPAAATDPAWPAAGVTVAVRTFSRGSLEAVPDGAGGLIVAWQEARSLDPASCNCRNMDDIYVQRIDASGRRRWGEHDLAVCTWRGLWGGPDFLAGLYPDGRGGAVVLWMHGDGPVGTFGRRVGPDGTLAWGTEGATLFEPHVGAKYTIRSAATGGRVWMGLDADDEAHLKIGKCSFSPRGPVCATPFDVALPGRFTSASILPSRGNCLAVFTTTQAGGRAILWVMPVAERAAGEPRRLLETAGSSFPVVTAADGEGGIWFAGILKSAAGDGPYEVRVQHADARGKPLLGSGIAAGAAGPPWAGTPVAIAVSPAGEAAVGWADPGEPSRVAVRVFDRNGRPRGPEPVRIGDRVEPSRRFVLLPVPRGWLAGWTERETGSTESLRTSLLAGDGRRLPGQQETVLLRRNDAVSVERAWTVGGGAVFFVFDMSAKALRAFRVTLR